MDWGASSIPFYSGSKPALLTGLGIAAAKSIADRYYSGGGGPPSGGGGGGRYGGRFKRFRGSFESPGYYSRRFRKRTRKCTRKRRFVRVAKRLGKSRRSRFSLGYQNKIVNAVMDRTVPWVCDKQIYNTQFTATGAGKLCFTFQSGIYNDLNFITQTMLGLPAEPSVNARNGIQIEQCRAKMHLQNNTNFTQSYTLYYTVPRSDRISQGPTAAFAYGLGTSYLNIPTNNGVATSETNMPLTITPFDVPYFTTAYKIYKTKRFLLLPGQGRVISLKTRNVEGKIHNHSNLLYSAGLGVSGEPLANTRQIMFKYTNQIMVTVSSFVSHTTDSPQVVQRPRCTVDVCFSNYKKARIINTNVAKNKLTWTDNGVNTTALKATNPVEGNFVTAGGAV